jgi:DNA-binding NarL/FixJ family response regulator
MQLSATSIKVMLIDDHQTLLWGLERLIEGERPRMEVVAAATDGETALAKAQYLAPDVILLDLDLDGKSGLDLVPQLNAVSTARILILTAQREQAILDRAMLAGARGIVRKDANARQVLEAIAKVHAGELWLDQGSLGRLFSELVVPQARGLRRDLEEDRKASLTNRERKIISVMLSENAASNAVLAGRLYIAEHTLRNHLTSIYHKLGVANRLELYIYATKHQMNS